MSKYVVPTTDSSFGESQFFFESLQVISWVVNMGLGWVFEWKRMVTQGKRTFFSWMSCKVL